MQLWAAEIRIRADRAPAGAQGVVAFAVRIAWEKGRIGLARIGKRADVRPRGFAERYGARAGLALGQVDRIVSDVAPAKIEHLAAPASCERQ